MQQLKSSAYKRNFPLLILEGAFFTAGMGFYSSTAVVPVFIDLMTGSKQLVGLTLSLASFFVCFGRLAIGPFMPHVKNHAAFSAILMFICRPLALLPAILILAGQPDFSVIALVFAYTVLYAADGLIIPAWSEVLANTVDEHRHGRLLGMQSFIGGFASIGAGILINFLLRRPAMDMKTAFGWIFLIGGSLFTMSCVMMSFTQNSPTIFKTGKIEITGYFKELPKYLLLEKGNTFMLVIQTVLTFAGMCTPFVILFADESADLRTGMTATLILVQTIGVPIGGWLWGQVCDRLGCVAGIRLAGFNVLLIALLPLSTILSSGSITEILLALAMLLAGISGGTWLCYYVYTVQRVKPESRSSCIVIASIVTLPATLSSYLAGYISEKLGFPTLFTVCAAIAVLGILLSFRLHTADKKKIDSSQ